MLELWGGHECSVNRVGEKYLDQTVCTGHQARESDLDLFASLGLKALRYPLLWERVAPERADQSDWSWSDARLAKIKRLGMRPIIGLVHHGAGPRYADLASDHFAHGLALHAGAAAARYPWVEDWTPINEPLTTARFSALYGHWHPHWRDERGFWRLLLNEIEAIGAAMRAIRRVRSDARLIQTEDFGKTYSTAPLGYQAEFDNQRRWLTWDFLFGRVGREHPFWERLKKFGLEDRARRIADAPCPPDIIGINHYITSDRFLDHRLGAYPDLPVGGNSRARYVDLEAVRVLQPAPQGLEGALREAFRRYGAPMAVTELHNACTREEQVRWFVEGWRTAEAMRAEGADVRAVTAWSLLGAYDWNSLLTRNDGRYEVGAFDIRGGVPRETALAAVLRDAAAGRDLGAYDGQGWWRRDVRLRYEPVIDHVDPPASRRLRAPAILILGETGTLGRAFARACAWRGLDYVLIGRPRLDLCDANLIAALLDQEKPSFVINAVGFVRVDDAEHASDACMAVNARGAAALAEACASRGVRLMTFSTDLVFDGAKGDAYEEVDPVNPLNVYGLSKARAERAVIEAAPDALVVRTAAFFSPHDPHNFAAWCLRELARGQKPRCAGDVTITPTYVPHLVSAALDAMQDGASGLLHLSNGGARTWAGFAAEIAHACGASPANIAPAPAREMGWRARRPRFAALGSSYGALLPPLEEAVLEFAAHVRAGVATPTIKHANVHS